MQVTELVTPDGTCRTAVFGNGGPLAILVTDAGGVRNVFFETAEKLAASGFTVAIPDLMYRVGSPFDLLPAGTPHSTVAFFAAMRSDPNFRTTLTEKYVKSANAPAHVEMDFRALLTHFARGPVGIAGYCMGGGIALRVASLFPDHIAAAASFHGGYLATTAPDSPHLGIPSIRGEVFVAGAEDDNSYTPEMRDRLTNALRQAGTTHTVETWPGKHGFAVPDLPSYDAALYARHLSKLETLFRTRTRT